MSSVYSGKITYIHEKIIKIKIYSQRYRSGKTLRTNQCTNVFPIQHIDLVPSFQDTMKIVMTDVDQ